MRVDWCALNSHCDLGKGLYTQPIVKILGLPYPILPWRPLRHDQYEISGLKHFKIVIAGLKCQEPGAQAWQCIFNTRGREHRE